MPITKVDLTGARKTIEQTCAACRYKQSISLDHGACATKEAPFALKDGDTLVVQVDNGSEQTIAFPASAFFSVDAATAEEVAALLSSSLVGGRAFLDASPDCVVIESETSGPTSSIAIIGGTAAKALGFLDASPCVHATRPTIGRVDALGHNTDVLALRMCHGCGFNGAICTGEQLLRTWDETPDVPQNKHRRVVNALFEWMKSTGRTHPDLLLEYAAEEHAPPDMLPEIDKSVIEIPMP